MGTALLVVHVLVSMAIIGLILLQHGKGADAGAAFGSGASGTVFGARGSGSFLSRATAILATLFFLTSLSLAYFVHQDKGPSSVMEQALEPKAPEAAVTPAAVPEAPATTAAAPAKAEDVPVAPPVEETPAPGAK